MDSNTALAYMAEILAEERHARMLITLELEKYMRIVNELGIDVPGEEEVE